MIKVAYFVEGQTERILLEGIFLYLSRKYNLSIFSFREFGRKERRITDITLNVENKRASGRIVIKQSGSDSAVNSDIKDNYERLISEGFDVICGLRDAFPVGEEKIENGNEKFNERFQIKSKNYIAVQETEAWMMAEEIHFSRISENADKKFLDKFFEYGYDNQDFEEIEKPSDLLAEIYYEIGIVYDKSEDVLRDIMGHLDFENFGRNVRTQFQYLNMLFEDFESVFDSDN